MKTILAGFVALAIIGSVAALAPTLDATDPYLQPRVIVIPAPPAPNTRHAEQDAAARAAEAELLRHMESDDYDIMRGIVYEPESE